MNNKEKPRLATRILDFFTNDDMDFLLKVKFLEIKMLGKHASTYCYNNPSYVNIEITNRCNFRCIWCSRNFFDHGNIDSDKEKIKKIIHQLRGVKSLSLVGVGEPLLYPIDDLVELIDIASENSDEVYIVSNCSLLTPDIINKLGNSKLSALHVSVDHADSEVFKRIRGFSLERIKNNLAEFTRLSKIPLVIAVVTTEETMPTLKSMVDFALDVKASALNFQNLHEYTKDYGFHRAENNEKNMVYIQEIYNLCSRNNLKTNVLGIFSTSNDCLAPFQYLYVNINGYLAPCCSWTTKNLANADDVRKSWNSKEIRAIRKMMLRHNYPDFCKIWCNKYSD